MNMKTRSAWRPLVLYWRRRRDLKPRARAARAISPVSLSYFPQIHLHFTTFVNNQNHQHSSMLRVFSAATVYRESVLLERRFETRMNTDIALRLLQAKALRIDHTTKHVSSHTSSKQNVLIRQNPQPRTSASFMSVFTKRQNTNFEEITKVFKKHQHSREQRSEVLSFRSASHETLLKTDRTEELVWRRNQPRTTVSEEFPVTNVARTTTQKSVGAPAVTTHAQSTPNNQTTAQQQITKLDPGLLDRLTDDVIRRVEKRARIERQRRGL